MKENVLEGSSVEPAHHESAYRETHASRQSASVQTESSLGLNSNVGVALVWFWWVLALVFAIVEKRDRRIRTQAVQSLIFMGVVYVINIVIGIGFTLLSIVMGIAGSAVGYSDMADPVWIIFMIMMCCLMLFMVIFCLGIPLLAIVLGLTGRELKFPVIYKWSEKMVAKWSL